jgi:hypothetical protein
MRKFNARALYNAKDVEEYFAAIKEFGALCTEFIPQSDWDNLDTSTKQNCSYVWADSIE